MADMREREKIAREIEKTSESTRKKYRSLKTGRIEEDIVDSADVHAIKRQSRDDDTASASKCEKKEKEEEEEGEKASNMFEHSAIPHKSDDRSHDYVQPISHSAIVPTIESLDNVFETADDTLATKIQNRLQTSKIERRCKSAWARWVKSIEAVLSGA
ncbi:hypothetical protein G5I_02307 [Acromyrmex echinatior]|uniref:Uncharacterized protein n=1 Tax=Acromyrmex echinatior TaxID=103372 RepID=F4W9Z6_ACREC|nr:hypothetical protein G5I_02307 [Acromyrmex echinatior]